MTARPWENAYPADVNWDMDLPAETMPDMFARAVRDYADLPCLGFFGKKLAYAEVGALAARFARGLQDLGYGKGARVGLCLPNCPFYVIAYHGALMAGAEVVNFNPLYADKELAEQIRDSKTEVMVTVDIGQILSKISGMTGHTPLEKIVVCDFASALPPLKRLAFRLLNRLRGSKPAPCNTYHLSFAQFTGNDGAFAPPALSPSDVAVLQYTGGTTGIPKAALLTHANITANTRQAVAWFSAGREKSEGQERMLAVLPFFHVFSMTVQMNLTLHTGGLLLMLPKFTPGMLLSSFRRDKPTIFAGVPTLYRALAASPKVKAADLASLTLCVSGGAPLPEGIQRDFKALSGLDLVEGYGLSETSPLTHANPIAGIKKTGSIGLPMPRTEVRICNLETGEDAPPPGQGELRIKGPQVMKGYWNRPGETAHVMDEQGFLRTGDVGYMDADGYVFIVDRIKDMIIASGLKVFPRKVEEAVAAHPSVAEVIVGGVKDDYRGETVKAWIVLKPGAALTREELKAFLQDRLSSYEIPRAVVFRETLPKTLIGKPDRKALLAEEAGKASH